jgi:type IV pilus assembly protein PilW
MKHRIKDKIADRRGFTLIELIVAILLSMVAMTTIYSSYITQTKAYIVQQQVVAMQQNIRAAFMFIQRELRIAGCDSTSNVSPEPGILVASSNTIQFTMDINDNTNTYNADGDIGDTDENVTYTLSGTDLLRNGIAVAENIDAIDFVYLDNSSPPVVLNPGGTTVSATNIQNIRSVEVTIVARTENRDIEINNSQSFSNKRGRLVFPAQNDMYRRRCLTTNVKCRNLFY